MTGVTKDMGTMQHALSLVERKQKKERLLVWSIKKLKVPIWFERSCKITEKKININRFIYYFSKASLGQNASSRILDICNRLGMPDSLLDSFQKILPDLSFIHFGFEEKESTCGYKIYGEYGVDRKSIPKMKEPFIGALGFKWDAFNPEKQVITKYTCLPALSLENIHERVTDVFQTQVNSLLVEASKDILNHALKNITLNEVIYLEVSDGNGPRRSFDINVYDAGLRMKHISQAIIKIFRRFSIPDSIYENIYNPNNDYSFGHISGGVDKDGKAFISLYGGLEKHEIPSVNDNAGRKSKNITLRNAKADLNPL